MIYWIIPNHNSSKPLSCGLWFKFWQNISNNGSHLTPRILKQKKHLFWIFFISYFPHHCQSHAIFSDAYFTVEIMLGRSAMRICNNGPLTALLDYIVQKVYFPPFTSPYNFIIKKIYLREFFVKFLEAVTVIREIMIGWKTFSVLYNYNLKLSIKLFQTFFLRT